MAARAPCWIAQGSQALTSFYCGEHFPRFHARRLKRPPLRDGTVSATMGVQGKSIKATADWDCFHVLHLEALPSGRIFWRGVRYGLGIKG
jgi:hypothetical protein